jgi:aminopeptidase N
MIPVVRQLFADETLEPNWLSEVLRLPSFDYLAQQLTTLWVDELLGALRALKRWLAEQLLAEMTLKVRQLSSCDTDGRYDALVMGQRALRNRLLDYLSELRLAWVFDWAAEQVKQAVNMTNAQAALTLLVHQQAPQADQALADFMMHFQDVSLVVDKWFSVQATSPALSATAVDDLCHHRAFVWTNPNRVRSVLGSWGRANPSVFHQADGEGYRLLAERIVEMDAINPQVAARLLQSFNHWRKLPQARRALAEKALLRLSLVDRLSRDSREVLSHLIGKV